MNPNDILKQITVEDFWLMPTGLSILCLHNGEEKEIDLTPAQTCMYLGKTSIIESYRCDDIDPDVVHYVEWEADEYVRKDWAEFVQDFPMTKYFAKVVAAQYLYEINQAIFHSFFKHAI